MRSLSVKLLVVAVIPVVAVSYTNCAQYALQNYELSAEGLKQSLSNGGILINDGAEYTNKTLVSLRMIHENADEMYVTDDPSCEGGGHWEDYAPNKSWSLRNPDGRVYARFRPKKTPDFVSPCFSDDIKLDMKPPTVQIARTNGYYINASPVYFEIKATDADSGVGAIECRSSGGFPTACQSGQTSHNLADGTHNVHVVAIDKAGNRSAEVTDSFMVDRQPPTVTVSQAPSGILGNGYAKFVFSGADTDNGSGIARFECSRNGGGFSDCTSPRKFTNFTAGNHTFRIRAVDRAGNVSAASAHSWTVDLSAPSVTITGTPAAVTNQTSATFTFTGEDEGVALNRFECRLGTSGAFTTCSTPHQLSGLAAGQHTFAVRSIDLADNRSSPQSFTWLIDTTKPTVSISQTPAGRTKDQVAVFQFNVSDSGGAGIRETFCSLNGAGYAPCQGSYTTDTLGEGSHTFHVMTRDNANNNSDAASYTWFVDLTKPTINFTETPANPLLAQEATFRFQGQDADGGSISRYRCKVDNAAEEDCNSVLELTELMDGTHIVAVTAIDSVGHVSDPASFQFFVDSNAPAIALVQTPDEVVGHNAEALIEYRVTDASAFRGIQCGFEGQLAPCAAESVVNVARSQVGTYKYVIEAEDEHGQKSSMAVEWRVELATKPVAQNFDMTSTDKVDVLVVIDISGSMDTERKNLGQRFGSFLDKLKDANLNWRVGVITTSLLCADNKKDCIGSPEFGDGYLHNFVGLSQNTYYLDSSMPFNNAKTAFENTLKFTKITQSGNKYYDANLGYISGAEQGIGATYVAVTRGTSNPSQWTSDSSVRARNFFRNDAALSVLVVSDADETPSYGTKDWNKPTVLSNLVKSKWPSKSFSFHSIIVKSGDSSCKSKDGNEDYGVTYAQLSKSTGGIVGSVCEADYGNQLGTMGQATLDQIRSVNLNCAPLDTNGDSVPDIKLDGVTITSPQLNGLKLTLPITPSIGAHNLEYTCLQ